MAARPGELLARAWQAEREADWERHVAPRWQCPCGHTLALVPVTPRPTFFTLTDDGLFDHAVKACPACARDLAATNTPTTSTAHYTLTAAREALLSLT